MIERRKKIVRSFAAYEPKRRVKLPIAQPIHDSPYAPMNRQVKRAPKPTRITGKTPPSLGISGAIVTTHGNQTMIGNGGNLTIDGGAVINGALTLKGPLHIKLPMNMDPFIPPREALEHADAILSTEKIARKQAAFKPHLIAGLEALKDDDEWLRLHADSQQARELIDKKIRQLQGNYLEDALEELFE